MEKSGYYHVETAEAQELLPQDSVSDDELIAAIPEAPPKEATPAGVREYICKLLQRRGVDLETAESKSAKWLLGTGEELRDYTRDMFIGIFGSEDGWIIHKDVNTALAPEIAENKTREEAEQAAKERERKRAVTYNSRKQSLTLLFISSSITAIGVQVIIASWAEFTWQFPVGVVLVTFGSIPTIVGIWYAVTLALNQWAGCEYEFVW